MSGLISVIVLALLALGLMALARLRGALLTLAAAALALGAAGYALQGRPGLAGSPRGQAMDAPPVPLTEARKAFMGQFTTADRWLTISEGYASRGKTEEAVGVLRSAIRAHPRDYALWVGLGNALGDHARTLTPAGRFAYARAAALAPGYPAPRFFLGLALARSGDPAEALKIWQALLADAPANASWRPLVANAVLALGGGAPPSR